MEEVKRKLEEVIQSNDGLKSSIKTLNSNVHELAINVERQTNVLETHKQIYSIEMNNILATMREMKDLSLSNQKKIHELEKDVNTAKGATGMAHALWSVAWAIGSAIVTATVFVMKGGNQ